MSTEDNSTTACDKSFCKNHMLLISPKDVSVFGLIKLLFFKNIGDRKFIDCPDGTEETFSVRFVIFVSILAQKLLNCRLFYEPLDRFRSAYEFIPNFKHVNGGVLKLLLNIISGKIKTPKEESPDYLTAIGLWDKRRDLDSKIKHDNPRYTSTLAVMAAKVSYENKAYIKVTVKKHWEMEFLQFFNCWNDYENAYTTQGFMWSGMKGYLELIGVCFRGTSPFDAKDWSSDVDLSWYELPGIGKTHAGFSKALGLQKPCQGWPKKIKPKKKKSYAYYAIRQKLKERLKKNPNAKFLVTGHSLGGALAILFPAILAYHDETDLLSKLEGVYTFGQPRVGDHKFGEYMTDMMVKHGFRYYRFVYCNDLVPRIPFDSSDAYYKHFGDCLHFDSDYKGQVLLEEPNKNYFSPLALILMFTNALWEFMRSFIMPYEYGHEYSETFTCRVWRFIGLFIAGLPAHGPTDYINLTRKGSRKFFKTLSFNKSTNGVN